MQVFYFPANATRLSDHPRDFLLLAGCGLITSFTSESEMQHLVGFRV